LSFLSSKQRAVRFDNVFRRWILAKPPSGDDSGKQQSREPVQKAAKDNEPMNPNKQCGFEHDWHHHDAPKRDGKENTAAKASGKYRDIETEDESKQAGDPDCRENVKETRKRITARSFWPPGLRRFSLESMEDAAHQEPACEDGNHSGYETGKKRSTERVHLSISIRMAEKEQ
jgi:hypothetical protein